VVTEHLGGDAAEPEDDDRAEHRFLHDADDGLDAAGDHGLDEHAHPGVAQPFPQPDLDQPVGDAVDVGHRDQVRRGDQPPVLVVRPRVIAAAQVPAHLAIVFAAQPGAAVPAHVEERAQLAVPAADDQDALPADPRDLERTGSG